MRCWLDRITNVKAALQRHDARYSGTLKGSDVAGINIRPLVLVTPHVVKFEAGDWSGNGTNFSISWIKRGRLLTFPRTSKERCYFSQNHEVIKRGRDREEKVRGRQRKLYCQQWDCLKLAIDQTRSELANWRGIVLHQDNVRPHMSIITCQKLRELGWKVLMHPPYSSDLALSDYQVFLILQNFRSDKKLALREGHENLLLEFFANRDQNFYENDIMELSL
ncbi:histone-lysine N-methyltransferase SETMAR [Trichonephila clavipes]|nr:histone-lysine N-methyltransferase SETMAR [Trichonephila clavipes]